MARHCSACVAPIAMAAARSAGHPLETGAVVACERGGISQPCQIIERSRTTSTQSADGADEASRWRYYVHYMGHDRRLDEWVAGDRIVLSQDASRAQNSVALNQPRELSLRRATRNMKRRIDEINHVQLANCLGFFCVRGSCQAMTGASYDEALEKEHEESTKVKNIQSVQIGRFELDAWYFSPFPDAFSRQRKLYVCEFTLKYMKKRKTYERHVREEKARQPPGTLIYRCTAPALSKECLAAGLEQPTELTIFEVDGSDSKVYCQCLCLLAKLFLDHKTLYFDVDPFLFYILCEVGADGGHRIAGYFSKEKVSLDGNNIACILVLPQHQRKGYGKLLIDCAYQLTIREGKVGSPEKPLCASRASASRPLNMSNLCGNSRMCECKHPSPAELSSGYFTSLAARRHWC
eukprot:5709250-Pleurochrysis_carterae.AAC.1